jgi:hypothetical protein
MDLTLTLATLLQLAAANLGLTITCVLVVLIHSAVLAWQARGTRASLERIEASAERIAEMVRDLHRR